MSGGGLLIFGAGGGGGAPSVYIRDTFTGADGTGLDLHTPDIDVVGTGWVEFSGTWEISGNRLRETVGDFKICGINAGQLDVDQETVAAQVGNSDPGLTARLVDSNNYIMANWGRAANQIILYSAVAGVLTNFASVAGVLVAGEVLRLRSQGNVYTVFVNDVQKLQGTSPVAHVGTRYGYFSHLVAGWAPDMLWDNFEVRPIA